MIVIDACAIVDVLVDGPTDPELLAVIADDEFHAPSLVDYEVATALRGHTLGKRLTSRRLEEALDDFGALQILRYPLAGMIRDVVALRGNFTVYDAAYVVLAQVLEAPLVTCDNKLAPARKIGVGLRVLNRRQ